MVFRVFDSFRTTLSPSRSHVELEGETETPTGQEAFSISPADRETLSTAVCLRVTGVLALLDAETTETQSPTLLQQ